MYVQLAVATLLPVLMGALLAKSEKDGSLKLVGYWHRQIIIGVIFGLLAIAGTEFGINAEGATLNVRDAAPIVAGLYFGGPAGIIAGLMGGIERWFSVLWGRGMYTRVACSVATAAAGFYAAALRRYLFDERKPSWLMGMSIGVVAEVLHLLLVFVTNMDDAAHAFQVVSICCAPMIICNGISVALAGVAIALVNGQGIRHGLERPDISQVVQGGMLGVVLVGFVLTVWFMGLLQGSLANANARDTLGLSVRDVEADIRQASDDNLLELTRRAAQAIPSTSVATNELLAQLANDLEVNEIYVVDMNGIVVATNNEGGVGFDMASGEQSAEFLDLLPGGNSYAMVQEYQPEALDSTVWRKFAGVRIDDGLLQVSYDGSRFMDDLRSQVLLAIAHRHVGQAGMLVVLDADSKFVGTRADLAPSASDAEGLASVLSGVAENKVITVGFLGEEYFAMARDVEGYRVAALLPVAEANLSRDLSVLVISFMEVIVFAALFAAIYVLIKHVVVRSIWQVNGTLGEITSGDLNAEVNVRSSSEFALLSDDINDTVSALRNAIAAESRRIERDLATAKAIQESALPRTFPPFPEIDAFDIYASMNAAREVGGDFYDFFLLDEHRLGFLIADVSGKGIPASLFMMAAKTHLANYISSGMPLSDAVRTANWQLCHSNEAGMFVTVWAAVLDWETGEVTYVNAGHNPPLLRHNGQWTWLTKRCGLFLGTFDTAKYRQETIKMERGDELLLYTDGVNEAFSVNEEEYGNERLEAFLAAHNDLHPRALVDSLRASVAHWAEGAEQSDDITIMAVEYGVPPEVTGSLVVPATMESLPEVLSFVHAELSQRLCPIATQKQIDKVVERLFSGACERMAEKGAEGEVRLAYVFNANPNAYIFSLTDTGAAFDVLDAAETAEGTEMQEVLSMVDDLSSVRDGDTNIVAFRKVW